MNGAILDRYEVLDDVMNTPNVPCLGFSDRCLYRPLNDAIGQELHGQTAAVGLIQYAPGHHGAVPANVRFSIALLHLRF
jgi:hypothetical protein